MKRANRRWTIAALIAGGLMSLAAAGRSGLTGIWNNPAAHMAQVTPTTAGASEVGSTDGIVLLGVLAVLIVVIPVVWYRLIPAKK